jgi:hypothetical protein
MSVFIQRQIHTDAHGAWGRHTTSPLPKMMTRQRAILTTRSSNTQFLFLFVFSIEPTSTIRLCTAGTADISWHLTKLPLALGRMHLSRTHGAKERRVQTPGTSNHCASPVKRKREWFYTGERWGVGDEGTGVFHSGCRKLTVLFAWLGCCMAWM